MMSERVKTMNAAMNAIEKCGVDELTYLAGVIEKRFEALSSNDAPTEVTGDDDIQPGLTD